MSRLIVVLFALSVLSFPAQAQFGTAGIEVVSVPPASSATTADDVTTEIIPTERGFWDFLPLGWRKSRHNEVRDLQKNVCLIEKKAHGLPIGLDKKLLTELRAAWGDEKVAEFVKPVAKANFSHRCYCANGAEKAKLGCQ